jgi:hypothetical protein
LCTTEYDRLLGPQDRLVQAYTALRPLAAAQAGVVNREQAAGHGLSARMIDRLVQDGHWRRLAPGVFLTADLEPGFESRVWAGILLGRDGACAGLETAARLDRLVDTDPAVVTVLVPHGRKIEGRPGWAFVQTSRPLAGRGAPPRTSVEDTVLDLCASARPEDVVGWLTLSVERRRTTDRRLLRALAGRHRHPRRKLLEELLTDVAVGARSPLRWFTSATSSGLTG